MNLSLSAINKALKYEIQLMRPLNLKPLLLKKLNQLSGGELQRVAIAECLSNDADLYLLDEPSAYLDVEQRLHVSKAIKDMMAEKGKAALVIES
jgi:ATP-binding cassette subfamily E protein 1